MKHLVIPDCHVKDGSDSSYLAWAGKFAAEHKPDVIVNLGDFADMSSLSTYDVGKKSFEGKRYTKDIEAANQGMNEFLSPILTERIRLIDNKKKKWTPRMVLTLGNHEERINRAINNDPKLEGLISVDDLGYEGNWEVFPYLEVVVVDGIAYSHYFTSGVLGRPVTSAKALTSKKHMSCIMGHVQTTEIDMSQFRADGSPIIGIFAGCFYQHDEDYLGAQGNTQHRGIWMLYEVENGSFWPHFISMSYLKKKYS